MPEQMDVSPMPSSSWHVLQVNVNGCRYEKKVESRLLLSTFLRELGLTGTHVGCSHGSCGACTVQLNGEPVRSCLLLAIQADGAEILTVEGLAPDDKSLHPIQQAFHEAFGFQCGFCTPGILLTVEAFLRENPQPDETQIRTALTGHLCRCTGYENIIQAVKLAAKAMAGRSDK